MTIMRAAGIAILPLLALACGGDSDNDAPGGSVATAYATGSDRLTPEELEAGRMDMSWREFVPRDTTTGTTADTAVAGSDTTAAGGPADRQPESWDSITAETVNRGPTALPVHGDVEGPSVLRVQVLLDRALFSPGVMDGRWGRNTEKAVYWLQQREGLEPSGVVDEATWQRLQQLARGTQQIVAQHQLTADDVAGPFVELPADYYERRDMDCQCYESLGEKLAERFHTTEALLEKLNPGTDLNSVTAGEMLNVPAVANRSAPQEGSVARIVVSDGGGYLHGLGSDGRILYHFPATLGSDYTPSPSGDFRVTNIAHDPTWHYQPDILAGVDDDEPDAVLPPGPNNAVGVVWMQLSKEHYGIHGTSAPETIGYATSNGCVRLTNWDAAFLAGRIEPGVPVEFRDIS